VAIGKEESWITYGGSYSVKITFFLKMENYQTQSQIYYKTRMKEREKSFFKKRDIFDKRSAKEEKGA